MKQKPKIGITQGDMNGIGFEVIIKTLMDNRINDLCVPVVYGSPKVAAYHRKALDIMNFSLNHITKPEEANSKKSNIISCLDDNIRVELGKSTKAAGEGAATALHHAANDLKEGKIDALVTAPIDKHNIQSETFNYPGHTEFFKDKFNVDDVLMLLFSEMMKVGVVTGHVPISQVPSLITIDAIMQKINIFNKSLKEDFGVRKPKIALLGLNPHSGDNGLIGDEEQQVIEPAIEKAKEANIMVFGPYPADGFFGSESYNKFDGVLAMYHDQGLTPFKSLTYEGGVNYTAGLPVIRTSPAHGTAYEIAGENKADPSSFRHALFAAIDIYKSRNINKKNNKNQVESNGD